MAIDEPGSVEGTIGSELHQSRRRFLKWVIRLGAGAFILAFALPALAIRTLQQRRKEVAAGDVLVHATGAQAGQPVDPTEIGAGQAIQAFPKGKADNQNNLIELVRLAEGSADGALVAYSAICTHLGCSVLPQLSADNYIVCPCHASLFDPSDGAEVVSGPAGRPLPALPIAVRTDGVVAIGPFEGPVGPQ